LELLHAVIRALGQGNGVVKPQRTERRSPDQTDTDRTADDIAVVVHQSRTSARRRGGYSRLDTIGVGRSREFAGSCPSRRALVIVQAAGVGINRALQPNLPWQEPERHLQLSRDAPVFRSAESVHSAERVG